MKLALLSFLLCASLLSRADDFLPGVKRIVFLGDSITHSGQYVEDFEAYAVMRDPERPLEILDLGLSSETVSGLSEEGHAGGQFPRPDLHERLGRVLAKTKPDLVFACYGMNDGIYLPLAEERFAKFREGIEKLHSAVEAAGGKIIHLTPPVYDAVPIQAHVQPEAAGYDAVLTKYAEWLLEQRARGWRVIDVHTAMAKALAEKRQSEPGVHLHRRRRAPECGGASRHLGRAAGRARRHAELPEHAAVCRVGQADPHPAETAERRLAHRVRSSPARRGQGPAARRSASQGRRIAPADRRRGEGGKVSCARKMAEGAGASSRMAPS